MTTDKEDGKRAMEHREKKFGVIVEREFDDFHDCDFILATITVNGQQNTIHNFTQSEWEQIIEKVKSQFK